MGPVTGVISDEAYAIDEAEKLLEQRDIVAALAGFKRAEQSGADWDRCAAGRWVAHMLLGDFTAAWQVSDAIRSLGKADPHRFWNGEDLRGKRVMLRCLHGFGDAVQMLRYVPKLQSLGVRLTVEVAPRLVEVARCLPGVSNVITWGEDAPAEVPVWDAQIEVMELPYFFRTEISELPIAANYVMIPDQAKSEVARVMGEGVRPRVGIVWAAGRWNTSRSLPHEFVQQIVRAPHVEFWSLQGGLEQDAWRLMDGTQLRDAAECGDGILTLAAVISELDLVITVDTLAAHLAGALGKPAWVLLQYAADWRWMVERSDSPWYATLRLYRQASPGGWRGVVQRVNEDLKRWMTTIEQPIGLPGRL